MSTIPSHTGLYSIIREREYFMTSQTGVSDRIKVEISSHAEMQKWFITFLLPNSQVLRLFRRKNITRARLTFIRYMRHRAQVHDRYTHWVSLMNREKTFLIWQDLWIEEGHTGTNGYWMLYWFDICMHTSITGTVPSVHCYTCLCISATSHAQDRHSLHHGLPMKRKKEIV